MPAASPVRLQARARLERLGVRPRKKWGQSFLLDEFVADAESALLTAARDEAIIEVGGGLGILTSSLLRRGFRRLTVIEKDGRLARDLRSSFGSRVSVVEADALEVDWKSPRGLVSNFPFSVATPLVSRAFELATPEVVGLVQREVAERLAAAPGSRRYGRLSILAALYGRTELFQVVPASSFEPEPAVESQLFRFQRREGPLPVSSVPRLEMILDQLFSGRRKQLKNLLGRVVHAPLKSREVARAAGWPDDWASLRPEDLAPDLYFALARTLDPGT